MGNLWPDDIATIKEKPPVVILREQALLLGQKTKDIVQAQVVNDEYATDHNQCFAYEFNIVAPILSDYCHQLFAIHHDFSFYPTYIQVEAEMIEEIQLCEKELNVDEHDYIVANNEDEFIVALKCIFATKKTKQIVTALLSQSTAMNAEV